MKNYFTNHKVLTLSVLLVLCGAAYFLYTHSRNASSPGYGDGKIDRLFRQMGLVRFTEITEPAEVKLQDLNGKPVRLNEFRGKIVFLNFWATWCPDCVKEMPAMQRLHRKLEGKDFVLAAVNIKESRARVQAFFKKHKLTFPGFLDVSGQASSRMAIRAIPTTFILDKNGAVLAMATGPRPWDSKRSVALFEYLIDRKNDIRARL